MSSRDGMSSRAGRRRAFLALAILSELSFFATMSA